MKLQRNCNEIYNKSSYWFVLNPQIKQSKSTYQLGWYLSEVARMVFIEEDSVMMQSTSITSAARMRSMLTNTTMACTDVSSLLSVVMQCGWLP